MHGKCVAELGLEVMVVTVRIQECGGDSQDIDCCWYQSFMSHQIGAVQDMN